MNENPKGMEFRGCFLLYPSAPSIRSKLEVKAPTVPRLLRPLVVQKRLKIDEIEPFKNSFGIIVILGLTFENET